MSAKYIFAVSPPLPFDAVKTTNSLPVASESRSARLKTFSTVRSQFAPCVMRANVCASFWKTIYNNNRSAEQQVGKLPMI